MVAMANDEEIARNLARLPFPYGPGDYRDFLDRLVPNAWIWLVTAKDTKQPIGMISLTPNDAYDSALLGYWFGRQYWGCGYATEAGQAVLECGQSVLGFSRFHSGHFAHNPSSGRVLEKLGFVVTGKSVEYSLGARAQQDHVDMALDLETP